MLRVGELCFSEVTYARVPRLVARPASTAKAEPPRGNEKNPRTSRLLLKYVGIVNTDVVKVESSWHSTDVKPLL